jgi:hypothetical protein
LDVVVVPDIISEKLCGVLLLLLVVVVSLSSACRSLQSSEESRAEAG